MKTTYRAFLTLIILPFLAVSVSAQSAKPQPLPMPDPIPAAQDVPYPGVIQLDVDATDVDRHIFRVQESIPVVGGTTVTLMYPEWLPANHADYGRVENLGGLKVFAAGERIAWTRDTVDVFAFHIDVPEGVDQLDLEFQFLSAVTTSQGRVVMTDEMLNLQWRSVVLYPAGYFDSQVTVRSSVRVPDGWQSATALEVESLENGVTHYKPVSLETLIDSPLFAGRYFKRLDLNPDGDFPVHLNIVADEERMLEVTPEQLEMHREMVQQADKLFQSHHFDHYDFLFALTDRMGGIGLEHHQSSENSEDPGFFTDWDSHARGRDLLPHEYTHSWNGKFRRPSDLWTPNASVPMRGSLLWLYEGQTQYWGKILTARSGMHTLEDALGSLAYDAAFYDVRIGREWRNLQDNTNDPVSMLRRSLSWSSWQRSEDYYSEGLLIWFDVDTLIRELSRGRRSLDDFAAKFFGINDGSFVPVTYEFDDIVATLNEVEEYDWATFLRERLDGHGPGAPLDGIERGGYKLVYKEEPTDYFAGYGAYYEYSDLTYSVGMNVNYTGVIGHVLWNGSAYKKGITLGDQIIAVNGTAFDSERLERAISEAKESQTPIDLLILDGVHYRTVSLDYFGGLRYPHLEKIGKGKSSLEEIFAPKK